MHYFRILLLGLLIGAGAMPALAEEAAWQPGLSDRELAIQRWFSHLTCLADRQAKWAGWFDDGKQLDVTAFRYQFAFSGYGAAAMAAKTPAYRELIQRQLLDLCERMIDRRTWFYVTKYWDYGDAPPDPCKYENVMYSGHLAQMMALYELLTGDMHYSEKGWDFVSEDGRAIHYRLEELIRGLHDKSAESPSGGICCEPGLVFADCNSHSAAAFVIHDTVHGTSFSDVNPRWFDWMRVHFRNKAPLAREFLYVIYNQKQGLFYPVGDVGADCWALGWGYPWFPDTQFARQGWDHIREKINWVYPAEGQCYAKNNEVIGCCAGGSLSVANSFIPLVGVQAEGRNSETAAKILKWLEANYGEPLDADQDGYAESYAYSVCPKHRISATGVIAAALATDGDSMRTLYRTPRTRILAEPTLAHVDYPNVYVQAAEYRAPVLRFTVTKGAPAFTGSTKLTCTQIKSPARVQRDGQPWTKVTRKGKTLTLETDLDTPHVFEIHCDAAKDAHATK